MEATPSTQATYDYATNPFARLLMAAQYGYSFMLEVATNLKVQDLVTTGFFHALTSLGQFIDDTLMAELDDIAGKIDVWEQRMRKFNIPGTESWFAHFRAEVQMGVPE